MLFFFFGGGGVSEENKRQRKFVHAGNCLLGLERSVSLWVWNWSNTSAAAVAIVSRSRSFRGERFCVLCALPCEDVSAVFTTALWLHSFEKSTPCSQFKGKLLLVPAEAAVVDHDALLCWSSCSQQKLQLLSSAMLGCWTKTDCCCASVRDLPLSVCLSTPERWLSTRKMIVYYRTQENFVSKYHESAASGWWMHL